MISIKQVGLVSAISDLDTGGTIALDVGRRIEQHRALTVNQTTASQTLLLPAPVDPTVVFPLQVSNIGSASFLMYGVTVTVDSSVTMYWNGSAWSPDVAPTATGSVVETLVPTAQNVIPDVSVEPKAGTSAMFFVNGSLVPAGISMNAAGEIAVVPATVGYNIEIVDVVTVIYYV